MPTQEPPRHSRWTPEGAPLDVPPATAALLAAEEIVREAALEASKGRPGIPFTGAAGP